MSDIKLGGVVATAPQLQDLRNAIGFWSDSTGTALVRPDGAVAAFGPPTAITYNGAGQPVSMTISGVVYALAYDAQDRLQTIAGGGSTQTVSYDGNGRVSGVALS